MFFFCIYTPSQTRRTTRRTGIVPDAENSLAATTVSTTITNAVGGASKGLKGKGLSIATKVSSSPSLTFHSLLSHRQNSHVRSNISRIPDDDIGARRDIFGSVLPIKQQ